MTTLRSMAPTLLLLLAACGQEKPRDWAEAPEVGDLARVLRIAQPAFRGARTAAEPYRLIGAQQLVTPSGVWRVTYKAESLMRPGSPVGAGGEVVVNVDLEKGTAVVGYGE